MQTTLTFLLLFLAAQLGERYPDQGQLGGSDAIEEATTDTGTGTNTDASTPPRRNPFDIAEPLNSATGSQAPATDAESSEETSAASAMEEAPARTTYDSLNIEPAAPAATIPAASTATPAEILNGYLEAPIESQLKGTPLALADVLVNAVNRTEQSQRVSAYWDFSQAVAGYYLALKEHTELATLQQGIASPSPAWQQSRNAADARLKMALDRARVAQEYVTLLKGNTPPGYLPLPADQPYCGAYETQYAQLFKDRSSMLAEQLNELLPRSFQDLSARAAEVEAARQWMFKMSDARSPQSDGMELLKAYELYAARRRMFLDAVKDYNVAILRYTEIATPGTLETERLVAMLIRTGSSPQSTFDSDVQRATSEEASPGTGAPNATPLNGLSSDPQTSTERSILVPKS
jgi:hypothetical protein